MIISRLNLLKESNSRLKNYIVEYHEDKKHKSFAKVLKRKYRAPYWMKNSLRLRNWLLKMTGALRIKLKHRFSIN